MSKIRVYLRQMRYHKRFDLQFFIHVLYGVQNTLFCCRACHCCGFVEKKKMRVRRKLPGDQQPLLFSPAQHRRKVLCFLIKINDLQIFHAFFIELIIIRRILFRKHFMAEPFTIKPPQHIFIRCAGPEAKIPLKMDRGHSLQFPDILG